MNPVTKILVPVDFSTNSADALRLAGDLSRKYGATLELLHVFQLPTYALPHGYVVPTPEQKSMIIEAMQQQLTAAEAEALEAGAVFVHSTLAQGGPVAEILRTAKDGGYDLIVMGTHGRTGLQQVLVGSVAENVVRTAPCAVLTVRTAA